MNSRQQQLYDNLMNLVVANEAFYHQDFVHENATYRIFNYRLASYTDFQLPDALECRGVMFQVQGNEPVRFVAWPPSKFFNLNENPMVMDLDLSKVKRIELKVDGSLISSYFHGTFRQNEHGTIADGEIRLKTKGSISSDQAISAMNWMRKPEQYNLLCGLYTYFIKGYTVNMEWLAPDNRVVIGYAEPTLRVLIVRSLNDGSELTPDEIKLWTPDLAPYMVDVFKLNVDKQEGPVGPYNIVDIEEFVKGIPNMIDVEGFVLLLEPNNIRIKVKTEWYLVQHRAKDSINSDRRLFETVLEEASDDLRSLFFDDPLILARIAEMEQKVDHIYNHMVKMVESYYEANKALSRKDYAIKGQQELDHLYFGLAMSKYTGKPIDYKAFLKTKWKDLGIKDEAKPVVEQ